MRVWLGREWACALLLVGCSAEHPSRQSAWTAGVDGVANRVQPASDAGGTGGATHRRSDASVPTTNVGTGVEPDEEAPRDGGDPRDGGHAAMRRHEPTTLVMCDPGPRMADLTFAVEWQWNDAEGTEPGLPLVANVTDDDGNGVIDTRDTPDVIMQEQLGNTLLVIDGATGMEHVRITGTPPYGTDPAIGDVDGDGRPEIISIHDLEVVAHDGDGHELWRSAMQSEKIGTTTPTLADIDQDGVAEVLSDRGVFDNTGALLHTLSGADSFGPTVAADLDGDGMLEMIYAGSAFHADGSNAFNADSQAYAAIADLDGDGTPEVFLATQDSLLVLEHDGQVRQRVPLPPSSGLEGQMTPPLIADFDGDGLPEIADASENLFSVYRGTDLSLIWSAHIDRPSGSAVWGASAFDFDGDGTLEIAYADASRLHVFDGADGTERWGFTLNGTSQGGFPVIADVDNDGSAEILLGVRTGAGAASLLVFGAEQGSFMPARRIWNQYNYVADDVFEDGSLVYPSPGSWRLTNTFRAQARIDRFGRLCAPARTN
jgi:outer membrane protein assembly factor BamB